MKTVFIFLLVLSQYSAYSQTALEWIKQNKFDDINVPGQKLVFKQLCTTETDSILTDGSATFRKADINGLGVCSYTRFFKDTLITKVELTTTHKKNREAFLIYYKKLVNDDYNSFEDQKNIRYIGFFSRNELKVKAEFFGSKNGKISTIILTNP